MALLGTSIVTSRPHAPVPHGADPAETRQAMAAFPLFAGADGRTMDLLVRAANLRRAVADEEILSRDDKAGDVYFVLKGEVRIVNYSQTGREVAYAIVPAGGYFGELSAIDGRPRSASVLAVDDCVLATLPASAFRETIATDPQIGMRVMEKLVRIIRQSDDRILDLATLSAYQRVYVELLRMKKPDPVRPNSWLIYPLPTQAQIAALASTTRETVARVLSQLNHDHVAERKGKTLYIRELARLEALAERGGQTANGKAD
jgi:CRP/FNR family transcriptional regulator, cyclic AMP receptor protein